MRTSLRRRLLIIVISLILLVWVVAVALTAVHSRSIVLNQIDERLRRFADMAEHTLSAVTANPDVERYFQSRTPRSDSGAHVRVSSLASDDKNQSINIWFSESRIVLGENTVLLPFPDSEGLETLKLEQLGTQADWRVIYRKVPNSTVWLGIGVNLTHARNSGAATTWQAVLPLLIVPPLTSLLLVLGIRRGLKPLDTLAANISARKPQALAPLNISDVPIELDPVVNALNDLLARLDRALASERRFTSNAAHELQTPLSAIKAEVQRCIRQEKNPDTLAMLKGIETRVRRSTETVQQLLTLARLDPEQEFPRVDIDLYELLIDVIAESAGIAHDRSLDLDINVPPGVTINGHPDWVRVLIRNLMTNAFKYADTHTTVAINTEAEDTSLKLSISNSCQPLAPDIIQRLGERFFRPEGQRSNGVGLGLSIAYRIAELHGANLELGSGNEGEGFSVCIIWPLGVKTSA